MQLPPTERKSLDQTEQGGAKALQSRAALYARLSAELVGHSNPILLVAEPQADGLLRRKNDTTGAAHSAIKLRPLGRDIKKGVEES